MTIDEVEKMPIEKIIFLPEFKSLERFHGKEMARFGGPVLYPHWEVKFHAKKVALGVYECFGKPIPTETMVMRIMITPLIQELIETGQLSS